MVDNIEGVQVAIDKTAIGLQGQDCPTMKGLLLYYTSSNNDNGMAMGISTSEKDRGCKDAG